MQRPKPVNVLAIGGGVVALGWFGSLFAGNKPDDGILAFAGTLLLIWATHRQEEGRRKERAKRDKR